MLVLFLIRPLPVVADSSVTIKVGSSPGLYCGSHYDDSFAEQWISSNPSIVSVTSISGNSCTLLAKSVGECNVTFFCKYQQLEIVDYDGIWPIMGYVTYPYSYNYHVIVTDDGEQKVGFLDVDYSSLSISQGESQILNYTVKDTSEHYVYNYNKLSWSSSNPKVAIVNKIGVVVACSKGTAVITATTPEGIKDTCKVTVEDKKGFIPISTVQELNSIRNNLSGKYILTKDIKFSDSDFTSKGSFYNSGVGWIPINGFKGVLLGNGHSIENIHSYGVDAGLITNATGAIGNLTIKNSVFSGTDRAGAFAAYAENIFLYNCSSIGNTVSSTIAGGMVGQSNNVAFYQCINSSSVSGSNAVGGITGMQEGYFPTYLLCSNKGDISLKSGATGLLGGIVGTGGFGAVYKYCWNEGAITGKGTIGGLIGQSSYGSEILQCYNTGKVKSNSGSKCLGGIVGLTYFSHTENCYNTGTIELVGQPGGTCVVGGIIGGSSNIGFSPGDNALLINNCINTGKVVIADSQIKAGALLGTMVGADTLGNEITVDNCYFLNTSYTRGVHTLFVGRRGNLTSLSKTQMKSIGNFKGFDFNRVWEMEKDAAYPTLIFQSEMKKLGILESPRSFKVTNKNYSSIKLSWSAVNRAVGYEVYRSTKKNGPYKLLTRTTKTSYTNTKLTTGTQYYYKIRGYYMVGGQKKYSSFSSIIAVKPSLNTPLKCKTAKVGSTSIKLTWGKVSGASGYEIYSSTSKKGKYTKVKTTTSSTYTKKGLKKKRTYYYKIRAYRMAGKKKVYSSWSTTISRKL